MQKTIKGSGKGVVQEEFDQSHFLTDDLLPNVRLPLSGVNDCEVVRLIPPREVVSDPAHLEAFFVTLASLMAQVVGDGGQIAGGSVNQSKSFTRQVKQKANRRAFLKELNEVEAANEEVLVTAKVSPSNSFCEYTNDFYTTARIKGLAKPARPQWQHAVSCEIVGRYQQVSFLLRVADSTMLSTLLGFLRQEYPHLKVERLDTDPQRAAQANQTLTDTLVTSHTRFVADKMNNSYELEDGVSSLDWYSFDSLIVADDSARQLSSSRWLLLSEPPVLPLTLFGSTTAGQSKGKSEANSTPLQPLLASLAGLESGESASCQLLIFGPVAREWTKYQQAQVVRLQQKQAPPPAPGSARSRPGRPPAGKTASTSQPPSDNRGLILLVLLATLIGGVVWSWLDFKEVLDGSDLPSLIVWLGLRAVGLVGFLAVTIAIWWMLRSSANGGSFANNPDSTQALQDKFSSPLLLATLRQVVSVNREIYLHRVCNDPYFRSQFHKSGYSQFQAARLMALRQLWLKQQTQVASTDRNWQALSTKKRLSLEEKLRVVNTAHNHELWEWVQAVALALTSERLESLHEGLAAAYSAFNSPVGNAFVSVPGAEGPFQSYSSLHSYDWPSPERLRAAGLAGHWPFNSRLFDWLTDLFDPTLPPAAKEHRGLLVLNALELSHLWHLPGGYETLDFVERSESKAIGPSPRLVGGLRSVVRPVISDGSDLLSDTAADLVHRDKSSGKGKLYPSQNKSLKLSTDPLLGVEED